MKRTLLGLLAVLLALSVCGCAAQTSGPYTVTKNGVDYVVDQENGTISDGTYTYQYTLSGNSSGYSIDITYPDGSSYSYRAERNIDGTGTGTGFASLDYDPGRYADAGELCRILESGVPSSRGVNSGKRLIAIVLLGIGLFHIISPHTAWYLSIGWKFRDAEPSDMALWLARAGGGVCCFIGVIIFFV